MKKIAIQSMTLKNFKGIKSLEIPFAHCSDIYGDNGTGKTSIFDAFTWLLFGKDSHDRSKFNIKTLDSNNKVIPKLEHEVSAKILIDGELIEIRRMLRESWVKKKGSTIPELKGNETQYFWNDVPKKQKEFQDKVSEIVDEKLFKLLTNPLAFNSINWKDGRNILINIVGEVSIDHIIDKLDSKHDKDLVDNLIALLNQNKSVDDLKKETNFKKKKFKDELDMIPSRIDEVNTNMPEARSQELIDEDQKANDELKSFNNSLINNKSKAFDEEISKRNKQKEGINSVDQEIKAIERDATNNANNQVNDFINKNKGEDLSPERSSIDIKLRNKNSDILSIEGSISTKKGNLEKIKGELADLVTKWKTKNAEEFKFDNSEENKCPTCQRDFDDYVLEQKVSEMRKKFNEEKASQLAIIESSGDNKKADKLRIEGEIKSLEADLQTEKGMLEKIKADDKSLKAREDAIESGSNKVAPPKAETIYQEILSADKKYQDLKADHKKKQDAFNSLGEIKIDNDALLEEKRLIEVQDQKLNTDRINLQNKGKAEKRIKELEDRENELSQSIADLEKSEYIIEEFIKNKVTLLEDKINSLFSFVNFKLFDIQLNDGLNECCEALINGVPFSDANTASKINAGIDIINTLNNHYKVSAPIFIDNRESVVKLIDSESQLISLIVSEKDKTLRF
jgi:DNA repair exonuclease SbcCD ATPase subunit